jgi:hypothetical protein
MPADYDDVRLMLRPAVRVSPRRPAALGAEIVLAFVAKLGPHADGAAGGLIA